MIVNKYYWARKSGEAAISYLATWALAGIARGKNLVIVALVLLLIGMQIDAFAQSADEMGFDPAQFSEQSGLPIGILRHHPHAVTMWWVIFNNPGACLANPAGVEKCGAVDLFGQDYLDSVAAGNPDPGLIMVNTPAGVSVIYATGGVTDPRNGRILLAASIYSSPQALLMLDGAQIVDPLATGLGLINMAAEIHLVVRDHGRARREGFVTQVSNFLEPFCSDPLLGYEGGSNLCVDVQAAVYAPEEDGLDEVVDLSNGQPLSFGQAYLFRQGDVVQAILKTHILDRRGR
ncbi:MAG: hypothetical protein AAGF35_02445 [Pseudomonadota bacterium]